MSGPDAAIGTGAPGWRPHLHFTAQSGWINDPLGLTHRDGRYHLFFQHVPDSIEWRTEQHWGHATSEDLVRWTQHGPALSPGDGDDGVWSGSVVVPGAVPGAGAADTARDGLIFYTGVQQPDTHLGLVRTARPADDSWTTWRKGEVIAPLPDGIDVVAVRDPFVLHDGDAWLMLVGAGLADGTATALTYRSDDLTDWRHTGLLAERHVSLTDPWTGWMWECPQLFRVDGRWVLLVSAWNPGGPSDEVYALGDLVDGRFVAETWQRLTYGDVHYAGSVFTDAADRPGLIHWLRGVADPAGGWAGAHSLAHTLSVESSRLVLRPHEALLTARTATSGPVRGDETQVPGVVDLEWDLDSGGGVSSIELADDAGELMRLTVADGYLAARVADDEPWMPAPGVATPAAGRCDVRVVVDGPVVEIFTDGGVMALVLPRAADGLTLTVSGAGTVTAHGLHSSSSPSVSAVPGR